MFDGIKITRIVSALEPICTNIKIDKVYHPEKNIIILKLNTKNKNFNKLVISLDPKFCAVFPSKISIANPTSPSTFCMLLRKHLENGILTEIIQDSHERLLELHVTSFNDLGEYTTKILYIELMGKYSNCILTENQIILDAISKYPIGVNGFREILAKRIYSPPPIVRKTSLEDLSLEILTDIIYHSKKTQLSEALLLGLEGFSKETITSVLEPLSLQDALVENLGEYEINRILERLKALALFIKEPDEAFLSSIDEEFTAYYLHKLLGSRSQKIQSILNRQLKKLKKKEQLYLRKTTSETDENKYKLKGELLAANLYRLTKNKETSIVLANFYEEDSPPLTISLNPSLSPSKNVESYFKKYNKLKEGRRMSLILLEELNLEISYLESIAYSLELADSISDIEEIEFELRDKKLFSKQGVKEPKRKLKEKNVLAIKEFTSPSGFTILLGKNNKQNHYLTFKLGKNSDLWFHIKDYPGAHVLIKNPNNLEVDEDTLYQAATLAATYSKASEASKIDVDYAKIKHVKKHPSGLLGKAYYTDYQTIRVDLEKSRDD